MSKGVMKEIIIILLLCFAIMLVLAVLLYRYIPTNKAIPAEISYTTPQSVKEMLKDTDEVDEDKVLLTYEINQTDLYNYQRTNEYKPGKTNPFSPYQEETVENSTQNGQTSQSGSSTTIDPGTIYTGVNPGSDYTRNKNNTQNSTSTNTTTNTSSSSTGTQVVNPGNYTNNKGLK